MRGGNFDLSEWLMAELMKAYLKARRGKGVNVGEHEFEMCAMENLVKLRDDILTRSYEPGRSVAFVQKKPVVREVFSGPFRDKVVHQFLFDRTCEFWERHVMYDSYACRSGKGVWFGVERADKMMRRASKNFTQETWVVKLDIQSFFMSLDRRKLLEQMEWGLNRQYPRGGDVYRMLKYLWRKVLMDDPCEGVKKMGTKEDWALVPRSKSMFCQEKGRGVVIGSLSSQEAANIYLDKLDRYVRFELGYKFYGRYADDFFFFVRGEEVAKAKEDIRRIERFLWEELGLTLHPNKRYVQRIERGLPFVGVVIYPRRIVPGRKVMQNFRAAARRVQNGEAEVELLEAYLSYMGNLNGYNTIKKVFSENGWDFEV